MTLFMFMKDLLLFSTKSAIRWHFFFLPNIKMRRLKICPHTLWSLSYSVSYVSVRKNSLSFKPVLTLYFLLASNLYRSSDMSWNEEKKRHGMLIACAVTVSRCCTKMW